MYEIWAEESLIQSSVQVNTFCLTYTYNHIYTHKHKYTHTHTHI